MGQQGGDISLCRLCQDVAARDGLCNRHLLLQDWNTNTSIDDLGILRFFANIIPKAFKSFKYGIPYFHKEILWESIRDEKGWKVNDRKIVIAAPRGSSKTTLLSKGLVLYCALFKKKRYIVISSKTARAAQKNLRWIRQILGTASVIDMFGDLRPDIRGAKYEKDEVEGVWTKEMVVLRNGVTIESVGMGQQLRSAAEGEDVARIELFLADDTETNENTRTPDRRETNEEWLFETVLPSLDIDNGSIIFINTLAHSESILSKLLKHSGWRKRFYQITYRDTAGNIQSLWPKKFPLDYIESIRKDYEIVGRLNSFFKEYYNVIRSERGFSDQWIRYYNGRYFFENGRGWLQFTTPYNSDTSTVPVYSTLGIDSSFSFSETADYSVLVPVLQIPDKRKFIMPYSRGRFSYYDELDPYGSRVIRKGIIDEAVRLHIIYHFDSIVVDTAGQQLGLFNELKRTFQSRFDRPPRIVGYNAGVARDNKLTRLKNFLQPLYECGMMHHMSSMEDLYRELVSFGDSTDDILDALFNAILHSKAPESLEYSRILPPLHISRLIAKRDKPKESWMTL